VLKVIQNAEKNMMGFSLPDTKVDVRRTVEMIETVNTSSDPRHLVLQYRLAQQ
jgi:hypothetical protein